MKKSNLKILSLLMLVAIVVATVFSCKKTSFPPDPNDSVVVKREIVVSALDAFTKDSLTQFSVTIVSPSATTTQTSTGKTFVVKDPVAGNYKITISKTGYGEPEIIDLAITLPTDPKASLSVPASALLTKAAPAVAVTGTTGGVIAVKANSEAPTSAPVAAVTIAPNTVFTLADGTKPATVSMSVTNLPVNTTVAPVVSVGGVNTVVVSSGVEIVNNQIPSQKLDLQPSGLVLSQPLTIDMYIGDNYPATMSLAEKTARQAGLTLNYVRKDGTVEVVSPDHFSADRNTVYYKISHFSEWVQTNKNVTLTKKKALGTYSPISVSGNCGMSFSYNFESLEVQTIEISYLLTNFRSNRVAHRSYVPSFLGFRTGFIASFIGINTYETWDLIDSTPIFGRTYTFRIPYPVWSIQTNYVVCHN
jgi:hypothetical protein